MTTKFECATPKCRDRSLVLRGDPHRRGEWLVTCSKGHPVTPVPGALYQIGPS